jgi:hypothetical protein
MPAAFCTVLRLIPPLPLYLTDFENRTFVGEIAIFEQKSGGRKTCAPAINHASINHGRLNRNLNREFTDK